MNQSEDVSEPGKEKKRFEFLVLLLLTLAFVIGAIVVLFFVQTSHTIFVPSDEFVKNSKTVDVLGYPRTTSDEPFQLTRLLSNVEVLEFKNVPNGHLAVLKMRLYDKLRLLFTSLDLFVCDSELDNFNEAITVN